MSKGEVAGVLLAGGLSRRFGGGDKCLQEVGGRTLLDRVATRAASQVDGLVLNANGEAARFSVVGLPVVADVIEGFAGPLAGILTGMEWAAETMPEAEFLASFPSDAPFFPENLVTSLLNAVTREGADMACAVSNGRTHPVFALWPVRLKSELRRAMEDDDMRKIDRWTGQYKIVHVDFPIHPFDPFFNINTPEDLAEAETIASEQGA